jgi:Ran GTPase-activating protein (RanGAP) involved in mRNA processing and transport
VLLTNADEQGEFFPPELRIKHSNLFTPGNLADWQKAAVFSNGPLQLSGNLRTQTNKYELCLSKQNLGVADAYVLAKALATNTWVQKVDLSDNNLEDDGIVLICRALMLNPRIWSINLKNNNLSVRAAKAIAAVLRAPVVVPKSGLIWGGKMKGGGKGLEAMLLDGNDLGSLGTAALCSALKANPSNALTKLSLASSRVGTAGAEALGLLLMSNQCRVRELNVNGPRNDIGAAGAMALSCGLQNNTSLVALEVSRNNISSEGTIAFVDMLENHNKTIKSLSLAHNMVKDDAGARLFKVLLNQSEFNELSLVHCDVHANKFSLALQQEWKPLLEEKGNKLSSILQLTASESEKKAHRLKKAVEDAARDEEDRAIQLAAATNSAHGIGAGDKSARSRKKDDEKKIKSATHLEGIIRDVIKGKTGSNVFVQKGVEVNWGTVRLWNRRGGIHTSTESSASNFIR